jgi:hypothetical protein
MGLGNEGLEIAAIPRALFSVEVLSTNNPRLVRAFTDGLTSASPVYSPPSEGG